VAFDEVIRHAGFKIAHLIILRLIQVVVEFTPFQYQFESNNRHA
jgi:hypothetical protein